MAQANLQPAVAVVTTGGTAVVSVPANPMGGFLQNPLDPADQGIIGSAEPIYVDPLNVPGAAPGAGNGTCFVIYPGQSWQIIPGQTTPTRVNAATSGHKFAGIFWN